MTLLVVCGLAAEGRIAAADGVVALIGGGDSVRLAADLESACRPSSGQRPSGILSFGVAGGLAAGLTPGDVCLADDVMTPDDTIIATDRAWTMRLSSALRADVGRFATAERPVADTTAKADLYRRTKALVVDMESHIAGAAAARHAVAFAALRVVTDPAQRALPHAASVGMRADGRVDLRAILASLARNPGQLPGLVRTGLDARAAFAALLRCRQLLGPGFALRDL